MCRYMYTLYIYIYIHMYVRGDILFEGNDAKFRDLEYIVCRVSGMSRSAASNIIC